MVDFKNKNDPIIRKAIWMAYNKKCFYCRSLISFDNFHVDHVIPKSSGQEALIEKYELPNDFNIDSYYNLVPSCFPCNNKKRDKLYDLRTIHFFLNEARLKVQKIEELEKKYRNEDIESVLSSDISRALKKVNLIDILNIINNKSLTNWQKNALQEAIGKVTPISSLNIVENTQLQIFIDEINDLIEEFSSLDKILIIKPSHFKNNRAGLIIYNEYKGAISYSLYVVSKENKDFIKEVPKEAWHYLAYNNIVWIKSTDFTNTLIKNPKEIARKEMFKYYSDLIVYNSLFQTGNIFLANEFVIDFIDKFKSPLGLEIKDEYSLEDLKFAYYNYFQLWVDEALKIVDVTFKTNSLKRHGYISLRGLEIITSASEEEIKFNILQRLNEKWDVSQLTRNTPIGEEEIPIGLFPQLIAYLKEIKINKVKRIFNRRDYSNEKFKRNNRTFNKNIDEKIIENIENCYYNFRKIYDEIVSLRFPHLKKELIPFKNSTKMIIEIDRSGPLTFGIPIWIHKYYLFNGEKEDFELILYKNANPELEEKIIRGDINKIEYKNKIYTLHKHTYHAKDFYQPLIMLKMIYNQLKEDIVDLFKKDFKETISKIII